MTLQRFTTVNKFEIWAPKYSTGTVLLAKHKVGTHNEIVFTKAPSMGTEPYYVSGEQIRKSPIINNGKIDCYSVKVSDLQPLERE